jgi:membrane-associated protein
MDWVLHLDTHLAALAAGHGALVYAVMFGFIFIETGIVVLPFLPGDSLKPEYLERTRGYFERHGRKTIVLARFVPVVRTLAPFVAALGKMPYRSFLAYNVAGGLAWVGVVLGAGYAFGNVPWISQHLTAVLLGIVFISILPGVVSWAKSVYARRQG